MGEFLAQDSVSFLREVISEDNVITIVAIAIGFVIVIVWVTAATIESVLKTREKERTRREVAAYVAEGSIDPDKAVALLNAKGDKSCLDDLAAIHIGKARA